MTLVQTPRAAILPAAPRELRETARNAAPWQQVLQVYLDRQSAPGTRRAYQSAVRDAFQYWGTQSPADVTAEALAHYRAHLVARAQPRAERPLSPGSVSLRLTALRGFWELCRATGTSALSREVIQFALAGYTSTVRKPYKVLSEDEQRRVLEHLRTSGAESAERDYALVAVMLGTGLRAAEVTNLQVGDIVTDEDGDWSLHVRQGKGRKDRLVPLGVSVREILRTWLGWSGRDMGNHAHGISYIFYGRGGIYGPLTTRWLQQIIRKDVRAAGITDKAITPHSLRHSMAIGLLRSGASLIVVQKLLGHASVETTQRYLDHLDYRELKRWRVEL